eukprot:c10032_g1_i9.p1 GENE.c10032_g1_i9~~c10032_g1_i9.p1  ORF type:complete len:131 (-),score=35.90 c10032_g1_i9:21-413(-)
MEAQCFDSMKEILKGKKGPGWHLENIKQQGAKGTAYTHHGNVLEGFKAYLCPEGCEWIACSEEFGTYSNLKVLGLRQENSVWARNHTCPISHPTKQNLKELFTPQSEAWRAQVLKSGRFVINAMFDKFIS